MLAVQQAIVAGLVHGAEGFFPPAAWSGRRTHHQLVPLDVDFHGTDEMALMEQRFWDTDTLGVADADDLGFHERWPLNAV
jgi:hypothetical protein